MPEDSDNYFTTFWDVFETEENFGSWAFADSLIRSLGECGGLELTGLRTCCESRALFCLSPS